jgi:DNA mismatch repair protein MutS2
VVVHPHSLELIEFPRVTGAIAARAACPRARERLSGASPIAQASRREIACERLAEAIRRQREPEPWCFAAPSALGEALSAEVNEPFEPADFAVVADWLDSGARTRAAWASEDLVERFPRLAKLAGALPALEALQDQIASTLDADGRVKDGASRTLGRARRGIAEGERDLHRQLERWAAAHGGGDSYVTRAGDRFVALVPASSVARRSAIVHDSSNSGQSLFVEPLEACEPNNRLIELRAEAAAEERRILRELGLVVRAAAPELETLEDTLATLDALRACAVWAVELGGVAITPGGDTLRLVRATHPLLAMAARRASARESEIAPTEVHEPARAAGEGVSKIIPLDLELGADGRLLLVSGPNMGGKTVLLKTVGLAVALAHAGLPVLAAEGSAVPVFSDLRADLGDEQSVDRGLSTFAAHLLALKAMAEVAAPDVLLLADELGAGTDPEEGAALGRVLVEHAASKRAWGVLTTHLGSLKRVASEVPGVVNGSLEFDLETLTSRYRFRRGVPGASHALDVASRLGFPEALIERARSLTSDESRALERLLAEVGDALAETERERERAALARKAADAEAAGHREAAEAVKRSLAELRRRLTAESDVLLARARELWQTIQREAKKRDKSRAEVQALAHRWTGSSAELPRSRPPPRCRRSGCPSRHPRPRRRSRSRRARACASPTWASTPSWSRAPTASGRVQLRKGALRHHIAREQLRSAEARARTRPRRRPATTSPPTRRRPSRPTCAGSRSWTRSARWTTPSTGRALRAHRGADHPRHRHGRASRRRAEASQGASPGGIPALGERYEGGRGVTVARLR